MMVFMRMLLHNGGLQHRAAENDKSPMPTLFGSVKYPTYISERWGPGGRSPPLKKWGVWGGIPPGKFLILRNKNKRFSLKDFNLSAIKSLLEMLGNVLVWYLVGIC